MKNMLAQGATVRLVKVEGWENPDAPLRAELEIEIPNFAALAGKRLIMPVGVFHAHDTNPFWSPRRTHSIYFGYPNERYEEVRVELPPGIKVEPLPGDEIADQGDTYYKFTSKMDGNAVQIMRTLRLSKHSFGLDQYKNLSRFYGRVLESDAHQATLLAVENPHPN